MTNFFDNAVDFIIQVWIQHTNNQSTLFNQIT